MKVIILGAGVIGTTSAWYLAQAGHEVTVVERREGVGLETSFANGGQVSVGHAEPWANPGAPLKILRWLGRDDAPLLFRPRLDAAQWAWCMRFLFECMPWRARANTAQLVALGLYSRTALRELRAQTGIAYHHLARGILHYYTDEREFEQAVRAAGLMRRHGLDREVASFDEAVRIEPALSAARGKIVGATYTASDESGDAYVFTEELAKLARAKGVEFLCGHAIRGMRGAGGAITGVQARDPDGVERTLTADAYVVALGSYSPLLAAPCGVHLPIYPAKGYSATVDVADPAKAPSVALTDDGAKLVFSRLGDRLRIAGTAELSGYSTELNPVRCAVLTRRAREMFPEAGMYDRAVYWAGLRPSTPSNVPLIGRTKLGNLWLNTGHGTLGWTLACGSARALADLMSGKKPDVDFRFV